jgi:hypothetical protein
MAKAPQIVVQVGMSCEILAAKNTIAGIRAQGFALTVTKNGGLAVTPASRLTDQLREMIRSNKAAIVDYLTAANDPHTETQAVEPKRLFRPRGPWLSPAEQVAADTYHHHHAQCPQCQAAGLGYGDRCGAGMALWNQYQGGYHE